MSFILMLLVIIIVPFWFHLAQTRATDAKRKSALTYVTAAGLTLAYWVYESQSGGNIRVDLLMFYPTLCACYALLFWWRLKWLAIVPALLLMTLNFGFFIKSYGWFDKHPG